MIAFLWNWEEKNSCAKFFVVCGACWIVNVDQIHHWWLMSRLSIIFIYVFVCLFVDLCRIFIEFFRPQWNEFVRISVRKENRPIQIMSLICNRMKRPPCLSPVPYNVLDDLFPLRDVHNSLVLRGQWFDGFANEKYFKLMVTLRCISSFSVNWINLTLRLSINFHVFNSKPPISLN